jgi:hypothetical protein
VLLIVPLVARFSTESNILLLSILILITRMFDV